MKILKISLTSMKWLHSVKYKVDTDLVHSLTCHILCNSRGKVIPYYLTTPYNVKLYDYTGWDNNFIKGETQDNLQKKETECL